ncbi:MAG: transcription antitermination factor NusB [Eggerthellaceae bacterium]|nr:transcription antitermination factor NusB [Eggerthellaceae bacterium]
MSKAFTQHEERTLARKHALQLMYQGEILEKAPRELIENAQLVPETQGLDEYALMLLDGTKEKLEAIDELIDSASDNWTLDRMPVVDRSLLRLTTYEMRYVDDVPVSVSINEAVNLAKEFGGDDSPRFINGILGRIATQLESEQA